MNSASNRRAIQLRSAHAFRACQRPSIFSVSLAPVNKKHEPGAQSNTARPLRNAVLLFDLRFNVTESEDALFSRVTDTLDDDERAEQGEDRICTQRSTSVRVIL